MPYPNEHACRLRDPDEFEPGSFRRIKKGRLVIIIAKPKGGDGMATQAFRYPKDEYTEKEAHTHCKEQHGSFEPAKMQTLGKKLSEVGIKFNQEVVSTLSESDDLTQVVESQIMRPTIGTQADWLEIQRLLKDNQLLPRVELEEKAIKYAAIMCAAPKNKNIRNGTPKQLWSPSKPIASFISFCESHSIPYVVLSRKYGLVPSWVEIENYDFFDMNLAEWQVLIEASAKKYNISEVILYSRAFLVNTDFHEMLDNLQSVKFNQIESLNDLYTNFKRQETLDEIQESQGLPSIELSENEKLPIILAQYPKEDKAYDFVIKYYFRGESVHLDFFTEVNVHLNGFTLLNQIQGQVKEPIETVSDAKRIIGTAKWKTDDEHFKVQAIRKQPHPKEWLKIRGVIPKGQVGEGVHVPEDRGRVEYGAKKSHMIEYFLHGKKYKGRFVAAMIPNPYADSPKFIWFFSKPEDQIPYVLSTRAKSEAWLPPSGISALPKNIRSDVPGELRYWESSGAAAQEKRKELMEHFKEKSFSSEESITEALPEEVSIIQTESVSEDVELVQMSFIPFSSPFKETEEGLEVSGIALSSGVWNEWYFSPEVVRDRPERILKIPICIEHNREHEVGKPTEVTLNGDNIEVTSLITDPEGIEFAKKKAKGYSIDALINVDRVKKVVKQVKKYVELTLTETPACIECVIKKPVA